MAFTRVSVLGGVLLGVVAACGGTTKQGPADAAGGERGGAAGAGSSARAGTASGARAAGGTSGYGNVGGTEAGKTNDGGAPDMNVAGAGQAGSGDQPNELACSSPYAGPMGGPRVNGPMSSGSCAAITDQVILARYKDFQARVPIGLYYEPAKAIPSWESPCSASLANTVKRGAAQQLGMLASQYTTDWFYEAQYCRDGLRHVYRNLRCDYFDGQKLPTQDPEQLAFLASLLWWIDNSNMDGSALLGYAVSVGNATDWVELCTLSTAHGDFGLCDEITLQTTTDTIAFDGTVELGQPKTLKTIKGDCH